MLKEIDVSQRFAKIILARLRTSHVTRAKVFCNCHGNYRTLRQKQQFS